MASFGIVVPYRDRAAHLELFVPHMVAFFQQPLNGWAERVVIRIVEQEPGLEFNRGAMKNIGFALSRDVTTATAFHDVDFLPIHANYRPPAEGWAPLVKGGFKQAYAGGLIVPHARDFFGGVVVFQNSAFEAVNGYSNTYWGYGFEDADLALRTSIANIPIERRNGEFNLLMHEHHGFAVSSAGDVTRVPSFLRNEALFDQRFPSGATNERRKLSSGYLQDGLSSLKFDIKDRRKIGEAPGKFDIELVTVSIAP